MTEDNSPIRVRTPNGVTELRCRVDLLEVDPFGLRDECHEKPELGSGYVLCRRHLRMLGYRGGLTSREEAEKLVRDRRIRERENLRKTIKMLRRDIGRMKAAPQPQQEPKRPVEKDGTIYFLRCGGYYKIGWTSDLTKRMRTYPPDSQLLATMPGTRKDEARLHKRFAHQKSHGREWFAMGADLTAFIGSVVTKHGEPEQVDFMAKPVGIPMPHRINKTAGPKVKGSPMRATSA